jgi:hypothetical protein
MNESDVPTPLCILLEMMREKWAAGDREGAVELARFVAPYLHTRSNASRRDAETGQPASNVHRVSDAKLQDWIRQLRAAEDAGTGAGSKTGGSDQFI